MLKHNRSYLNVDSEEFMCVIMKCNTFITIGSVLNRVC